MSNRYVPSRVSSLISAGLGVGILFAPMLARSNEDDFTQTLAKIEKECSFKDVASVSRYGPVARKIGTISIAYDEFDPINRGIFTVYFDPKLIPTAENSFLRDHLAFPDTNFQYELNLKREDEKINAKLEIGEYESTTPYSEAETLLAVDQEGTHQSVTFCWNGSEGINTGIATSKNNVEYLVGPQKER